MTKTIDEHILDLITVLGDEFNILKYVYNKNKSFVAGVTPIYYSGPYWDEREIISAIKTLLVGSWLSSGEEVKSFENKFSMKINQKNGLMLNSGSSANLIMIAALKKLLNWKDGDEIIVSVVGFPTTYSAIIQNNLKCTFVDIEMDTLNFDLNLIESKITNKTKAILLSPVLGNPCNMDKLTDLCNKYKLELILDNCDSLGSKWKDKYLNEYAIANSNSFYAAHHICTGEGGMIVSDNSELIKMARSFTSWGRKCICSGTENLLQNGICGKRFGKWLDNYDGIVDHKYVFENVGYNLKPLELQGSIGLVQLDKFDEIHEKRKNSKKIISDLFNKYIKNIKTIDSLSDAEVSWFGTPIICDNKDIKNKLVEYLEKNKIQTRNYFAGNILLHPAYQNLGDFKDYPNANKVLDQVFFIGASPHYNDEIFEYIEKILKEY